MENPNPDSSSPQEPAPQQQPAPLTPPPTPAPGGGITDQQWILFLNLSALAGLVIPSVGHVLGPLVIWLVKKQDSAAIDTAGRAVLNFQISWSIWMLVSVVIAAVGSCLVVPVFLPIAVFIAWIVIVIMGSIKASNSEPYTFPLTIKIL